MRLQRVSLVMESNFIRLYDGVFSPILCQQLIHTYEKLWKEQEEQIKKMSLCYAEDGTKTCGACNCQRLDIMRHYEFNESFKYVMFQLQNVIEQYKRDANVHPAQWPKKYAFENLRIKRYLCNDEQQHDYHSDVGNIESTKRFVAIVAYLNDDFEGGETEFPHFNLKFKPVTGSLLMFPCTWSYLHKGNPSTKGYGKYILGSFLNYSGNQNFNRIGDKTLGIEGV